MKCWPMSEEHYEYQCIKNSPHRECCRKPARNEFGHCCSGSFCRKPKHWKPDCCKPNCCGNFFTDLEVLPGGIVTRIIPDNED